MSIPVATVNGNVVPTATPTGSDYGDVEWANDPTLKLETLESLRGCFGSELLDPSAWTLQRITVLTGAGDQLAPREVVRNWYECIARLTDTPAGEPLRLPRVTRPGDTPFQRTWEEAERLVGQARDLCFNGDVLDCYKNSAARTSIEFLIPDVLANPLFRML